MKLEDEHTRYGACMKAQHKTLPDGTGEGIVWILAQNLYEATFFMDNHQEKYQHQRQQ